MPTQGVVPAEGARTVGGVAAVRNPARGCGRRRRSTRYQRPHSAEGPHPPAESLRGPQQPDRSQLLGATLAAGDRVRPWGLAHQGSHAC